MFWLAPILIIGVGVFIPFRNMQGEATSIINEITRGRDTGKMHDYPRLPLERLFDFPPQPESLKNTVALRDNANLDPSGLLNGVAPELGSLMREANKTSPLAFRITSGNRTQAEQNALYEQGRTTAGNKVTWTRNSRHVGGRAVDIYVTPSQGRSPWDERDFILVGRHVKKVAANMGIPIKWGGDFMLNKDYPHFELTGASSA